MPCSRTWTAALVLALTCGVGSWVLPWGEQHTRFARALESFAADLRPGDCVVVLPSWNRDAARALRHARVPVLSLSDPEVALAAGCTRAWALAPVVAGTRTLPSPWARPRGVVEDVEVFLLERGSSAARALDLWPAATVDAAAGASVRPGVARVSGIPYPCLSVSSPGAGTTRLHFPAVAMDRGLLFTALRERAVADDIAVSVETAGVPLLRAPHPVETAYSRLAIPARAGTHPLDVVLTTGPRGGSLCLDFQP
jgi:hypothetical protein